MHCSIGLRYSFFYHEHVITLTPITVRLISAALYLVRVRKLTAVYQAIGYYGAGIIHRLVARLMRTFAEPQ